MKEKTLKGDWYDLVKSEFQKAKLKRDEKLITETDMVLFRCDVEKALYNLFYLELHEKKETHIKVKHNQYYGKRLPQAYLEYPKFDNDMCSLLFNLRCSSVNDFRDDFHSLHGKRPSCKMLCGEDLYSCQVLSC